MYPIQQMQYRPRNTEVPQSEIANKSLAKINQKDYTEMEVLTHKFCHRGIWHLKYNYLHPEANKRKKLSNSNM